jgi:hypothetical protein
MLRERLAEAVHGLALLKLRAAFAGWAGVAVDAAQEREAEAQLLARVSCPLETL